MTMKPRISNFKICVCSDMSLKMTQRGIIDARNASLDNHSKKIISENIQKTSKTAAEDALNWLLCINNKTPKIVLPC